MKIKKMTSHRFWSFILKHMLVTYLTLIPSFFLSIISLSLLSVGIFLIHLALILIGTIVMFRKYVEEKVFEEYEKFRIQQQKFTKKLEVLFKEFKNKIADSGRAYSLLNIAFIIANDKAIQNRTKAWSLHLRSLLDEINKKTSLLDEKLKEENLYFSIFFRDFQDLLFLLRDFRKAFYMMVEETRQDKDWSKDINFSKAYKKFSEEYNNYVDRLKIFADEVKAEFGESICEDLTEHVKSLNELN